MSKKIEALKEKFMSGEKIRHTLRDCTLEHPHLDRPDTRFEEDGPYKMNALLSEGMAKDMKEIGFNVKKNKDGVSYIVCKRKQGLGRPPVNSSDDTPIDPKIVGNGSLCDVHVTTYKVKVGGKVHLPCYLDEVTITELIEYTGGGERESLF